MRRQGYYATHIIPYHTVASKDTHTYTAGEHSYYESLTTNVYETVAAWQKTMAFVPSAKDGSQMTSSFLPVGHTDRHEGSFEHRNDICFWANDNYPVPCILHSIPFTIIFMPLGVYCIHNAAQLCGNSNNLFLVRRPFYHTRSYV